MNSRGLVKHRSQVPVLPPPQLEALPHEHVALAVGPGPHPVPAGVHLAGAGSQAPSEPGARSQSSGRLLNITTNYMAIGSKMSYCTALIMNLTFEH